MLFLVILWLGFVFLIGRYILNDMNDGEFLEDFERFGIVNYEF